MGETLTQRSIAGLPIQPVQQRSPYLNILIYGSSGVGKTTLAGSADLVPSMRKVLVVDIEGGTESLRNKYGNVDTVRVTDWNQMQAVYDELHKSKDHGYETVILDSLTEIQKFNMYNIMQSLARTRPDLDPDVPGMREWGKNLEQMRRYVRAFRDLPMHTIFTALVREDKDQRTGMTSKRPSLSGKLADEVAAFLDVVAYYYVKIVGDGEDQKQLRLLLTQATESTVAKDRSGNLPMIVEEPTMATLHQLMYPNNTKQSNTKQEKAS